MNDKLKLQSKRLLCVALCAGAVIAWQWLTVRFNYGRNWTALFQTGSAYGSPPALASENIYIFANSYGYDGQFYHLIAHDPLFRKGFDKYVDEPRLLALSGLSRRAGWAFLILLPRLGGQFVPQILGVTRGIFPAH